RPHGSVRLDAVEGLQITIAGQQWVSDGLPWLKSVSFGHIVKEPGQVPGQVDAAAGTITQTYEWGKMVTTLRETKLEAAIDVALHNETKMTITDFDVRLCRFTLPSVPSNWDKNSLRIYSSLDRVVAVGMDLPGVRVVVGPETVYPPLRCGLSRAVDKERLVYDWHLAGGALSMATHGLSSMPLGLAQVPAGETVTFSAYLRWAAPETRQHLIVADLHRALAEVYPSTLEWNDRRPIGMLMFQSANKTPENPRGWFKEADPPIDVTTEEGLAHFRDEVLKWADRSVSALKSVGAQGGIVWNVEGEENPHPITYIGDPRMLKTLAPEMDAVADEMFQRFLDAGLRTGICIRPTQIYLKDGKWAHGTGSHGPERNPLHEDYEIPEGLSWWKHFPVVERMSRKIAYAQERWGCTIFYVDTNGMYVPAGRDRKMEWLLITGRMWRELQALHPDCLIIPELMRDSHTWHTTTHAYAAPYMELDLRGYGTPEWVRTPYPNAFSVINISDGPIDEKKDVLVEAVRSGDILLTHGWYHTKRNSIVRSIYEEAGVSLEPPSGSAVHQKIKLPRTTMIYQAVPPYSPVSHLPAGWEVTLGPPGNPGFREVRFTSPGGADYTGWVLESALK
ncbi:MAG: hypothetical protein WD708_00805, partial [Kiritimatiellia bacterium]